MHLTLWLLAALILGHVVLVCGVVRRLFKFKRNLISDSEAPRASVIVCLRGGDPFLRDCLQGLLDQDYPRYDVQLVVDHPDDPAMPIVDEIVAAEPTERICVQYLREPRESCSLKCSSIVQAVGSLADSCDFIAQLDADVVPHRTWLRELATALADDECGAATGNRWYMPNSPSPGALVRYLWNSAAVVKMCWYRIAWGGTLAVKTSVLRETDLLDKWSNAFCEDTMLYTQLKKAGYKLVFVPSLIMVNREDCDLAGFYSWVRRQLLSARLYHPGWPAVVGHGVSTTLVPLLAVVLVVAAFIAGAAAVGIWALAGVLIYQASLAVMLVPIEWAVRRVVRGRGEPSHWLTLKGALLCCCMLPVTQVVYFAALCSASLMRTVAWRGVEYRVSGPWAIRMREYHTFQRRPPGKETASL